MGRRNKKKKQGRECMKKRSKGRECMLFFGVSVCLLPRVNHNKVRVLQDVRNDFQPINFYSYHTTTIKKKKEEEQKQKTKKKSPKPPTLLTNHALLSETVC
jgi:beta-glucosidase/6-phospho-beta-glucosidase/beta-galactosidase